MKERLLLMGAILGVGILAYSCGGGSGTSTTPVALYFTDDASIYPVVEITYYEVNLCQDPACTNKVNLFSDQNGVTVDLTNLNGVLQYIGSANVPEGSYPRLEVILARDATICDNSGNCYNAVFTEMDEKPTRPNVVNCPAGLTDQNGNQLCYIRFNGVINPTASSKLVLDFNLKDFEVNTNTTPWQIEEVKVSPITPSGEHRYEMYAVLQSVDTTNSSISVDWNGNTFDIAVNGDTKCEIADTYYYGQDCLNQLPSNICLEIKVDKDPATSTDLTAVEIETKSSKKCGMASGDDSYEGNAVEVKGMVSGTDTNNSTLTLQYGMNDTRDITITDSTLCEYEGTYYSGADCLNNLQTGWMVEVKVKANNEAIKIEKES